ncbi:cytochrome c [Methyloversatilis sp.]|uniref:c-type cytochrome n=1 Tax=Methyloversatilis sp. TaxID=2569862 RepID=UPI0035AFB261
MMNKTAFIALAVLVGMSSAHAGDAAKGKEKSAACAACHGADGNSPAPAFPRIGGQHEDYLLQALQQYKKGSRKNAIMAAQVGALSNSDMADLAAYFASQAGPLVTRR